MLSFYQLENIALHCQSQCFDYVLHRDIYIMIGAYCKYKPKIPSFGHLCSLFHRSSPPLSLPFVLNVHSLLLFFFSAPFFYSYHHSFTQCSPFRPPFSPIFNPSSILSPSLLSPCYVQPTYSKLFPISFFVSITFSFSFLFFQQLSLHSASSSYFSSTCSTLYTPIY